MARKVFIIFFFITSSTFAKDILVDAIKFKPAKKSKGGLVKFEEVEIFSCRNIPNIQFLLNKKQDDICQIGSTSDASHISAKLAGSYWGDDMIWFEKCPLGWTNKPFCEVKKLRKF